MIVGRGERGEMEAVSTQIERCARGERAKSLRIAVYPVAFCRRPREEEEEEKEAGLCG